MRPTPRPTVSNPRQLPVDWDYVRNAIYDDVDGWGFQAAHFIKVYRNAAGVAPTFAELFSELVPEMGILRFEPEMNGSQRARVRQAFMQDIAFTLMLAGWIHYGRSERSLVTGRRARKMPPCGIHCISAHFTGNAQCSGAHYCLS
jgi:hypothetical protein